MLKAHVRAIVISVLAVFFLLPTGCGDEDPTIDPGPGPGPFDDPRDPRRACLDAPVLGVAGASSSDTFEGVFRYEDGWSITDPMTFQIADDVIGVAITVELAGQETGLASVVNNGETLLDIGRDDPDLEGIAPFFHVPQRSGSITFPMDEELFVRTGCLTIVASGLDDLSGETAEVFISTKRGERSRLDVTAIVVGETVIEDSDIEAVFLAASALYENANAGYIGDVEIVQLDWEEPFIDSETDDIHDLRASVVGDDPGRLNVFFIQDFYEEGTAGVAAGIPGPIWVHGTSGSGVIISVDNNLAADGETVDIDFMASVLAHEFAHQFGLFHSTEAGGDSHDLFDDTAECTLERDGDGDGEVSGEECIDDGGRNFMFWTGGDYDQNEISRSQALIISSSPVMR